MSSYPRVLRQLHPWRVAAVALMALMLTMSLWGHAEAAIGVTANVTDNVAGNQTDMDIDILLDNHLGDADTIVITLPAGFEVQDGALTDVTHTLMNPPTSIDGNNAARTITITINTLQLAALPTTIEINPSAEILNPDVPDDGTFAAQIANIVAGIDSAGTEGTGWDAVVKPALGVGQVVRDSNTVVIVTLPALAGYAITADETITGTIPGTALTGAAPIMPPPPSPSSMPRHRPPPMPI